MDWQKAVPGDTKKGTTAALPPFRRKRTLLLLVFLLAGCENETVSPSSVPPIISYARHRDSANRIKPIFSEAPTGFDAGGVDSPTVVLDPSRGRLNGDPYLLYYEATDRHGVTSIGLITSRHADFRSRVIDRVRIIAQGHPGSHSGSAATDPSVLVDLRAGRFSQSRYQMWFEGRHGPRGGASSIYYCVSADGVSWSTALPCCGLTPDFGFKSRRVADPIVLLDGSLYRMWFEVTGEDGHAEIGHAESRDGVAWRIVDGTGACDDDAGPVFRPRQEQGRFDSYSVGSPAVAIDLNIPERVDGRYLLWYEAGDDAQDIENSIGVASSPDGLHWNRYPTPVLKPSSHRRTVLAFDSGDLEHPSALIDPTIPMELPGHFLLWYTGGSEEKGLPNRIGHARGESRL